MVVQYYTICNHIRILGIKTAEVSLLRGFYINLILLWF